MLNVFIDFQDHIFYNQINLKNPFNRKEVVLMSQFLMIACAF
nr:MAG TPA: hypothetical protein [Caudoviricetes sp.]